jgi:hypothetical protein
MTHVLAAMPIMVLLADIWEGWGYFRRLVEGDFQGKQFSQANTNYYGFRDGNCIDFHVSQIFRSRAEIDYGNLTEFGKSFGYSK